MSGKAYSPIALYPTLSTRLVGYFVLTYIIILHCSDIPHGEIGSLSSPWGKPAATGSVTLPSLGPEQALSYDYDVTFGWCVVPDRNLACVSLIRHKTLSESEVEVSAPIATVCFVPQSYDSI